MGVNEFSRKETRLVGRLLIESNPALAIKLLAAYTPPPKPVYDLKNIPLLYNVFCEVNHIDKHQLSTPYSNVALRRVFVGAVAYIYDPDAIKYNRRMRDGVVKGILVALGMKWPTNISKLAREAKIRREVYDDFREKMDETIKLFIREINPKKKKNESNHLGAKKSKGVRVERNRQQSKNIQRGRV